MKNWTDLEPDLYKLMNKHYSPGRDRKIDKIVLHYNAGVGLSTEQVWNIWQSREASAHYQVETSGRIGQLVRDKDTAWHAGNWAANSSSIGIEHANNTGAPSWGFTKETLEEGAHLVAALCLGYGLGRPAWRTNVFPHSDFTSTSCPGELQSSLQASYMARAQAWYDAMKNGTTPAAPAKPAKNKPKKLAEDGLFGADTADALAYINGTPRDRMVSSQSAYWKSRFQNVLTTGWEWVNPDDAEGSQVIMATQRYYKRIGNYAGPIDGLVGPDWEKATIATYGGKNLQEAVKGMQRAINKQLGY